MQQRNHLDISYSLYPRSLHHQSKNLLKGIKHKGNYALSTVELQLMDFFFTIS